MSTLVQGCIDEANEARAALARAVSAMPTWHAEHARVSSRGYVGWLLESEAEGHGSRLMSAVLKYARAEAMLALAVRLEYAGRVDR